MLAAAILPLLFHFTFGNLQVLDLSVHDTMGPQFAVTQEEIEDHPCIFFNKVAEVDPSLQCHRVGEEEEDQYGTMIKLTQTYEGIAIECADIRININNQGHTSVNGEYFIAPLKLNPALLTKTDALNKTMEVVNQDNQGQEITYDDPEETIICSSQLEEGTTRLGFKTHYENSENGREGFIFIDAETGEHLKTHSHSYDVRGKTDTAYYGRKEIEVTPYHGWYYAFQTSQRNLVANDCSSNTCTLVARRDKDKFGGAQSNLMAAYWGAQEVYDLLWSRLRRKSFDGRGSRIYIISINQYNAYWKQSRQGYGYASFGHQLGSVEVVGHEIMHGIIGTTADLIYFSEPGAINEAISDIFGIYSHFKILGGAIEWEIGTQAHWFGRSAANPKQFQHPDTYKGQYWYYGYGDNAGVHTNSGVLNHIFYMLVVGEKGKNDNQKNYEVKAIGLEKAFAIVYRALIRYLTRYSRYYNARRAFVIAASDMYGSYSAQKYCVEMAFYAGGVGGKPLFTPSQAAWDKLND